MAHFGARYRRSKKFAGYVTEHNNNAIPLPSLSHFSGTVKSEAD